MTCHIINSRTDEPLHNHLGKPISFENRNTAEQKANLVSSGNKDDFEVTENV